MLQYVSLDSVGAQGAMAVAEGRFTRAKHLSPVTARRAHAERYVA